MTIVRVKDTRGSLMAIEEFSPVPFSIKRVFVISNIPPTAVRGCHAHFKSDQYLIVVSGSCTIILDDAHDVKEYHLTHQDDGLFQSHGVWGEMKDFSHDCVLLVVASDLYNANDYIHDYEYFKKWKLSHES